jgi:hypothetical protein
MALSEFTDKSKQPDDTALRGALGKSHAAWTRLIELVEARIGPVAQVWGFTSASTGWGLRLKRGDRIIVYMTPRSGSFLVSLALGEKAAQAALASALPAPVLAAIEKAPRYAEGRGVRMEVRLVREAAPLALLAQIKNDN